MTRITHWPVMYVPVPTGQRFGLATRLGRTVIGDPGRVMYPSGRGGSADAGDPPPRCDSAVFVAESVTAQGGSSTGPDTQRIAGMFVRSEGISWRSDSG